MPIRFSEAEAPALTAVTKSLEVCQRSAAENLPARTDLVCAVVSLTVAHAVAFSPFGPVVTDAFAWAN